LHDRTDALRDRLHRRADGLEQLRGLRHPLLDGAELSERDLLLPVRAVLQRRMRLVGRKSLRQLHDDLFGESGLQQQ
jgi:hypothetical protein